MSPEELARLNNIPNELKELNQWCLWKKVIKENGRVDKIPYQPNGQKASVTDVRTYSSYNECFSVIDQYEGLGFIFTVDDPYVFIDLDDYNESEYAKVICKEIDSYLEYSPSGEGIHIICKAKLTEGRKNDVLSIEIYPHGRFATMTGNAWCVKPINDCQNKAEEWWARIGKPKRKVEYKDEDQIYSDEEIIERGLNALNGEKFKSLWEGRWKELYPEVVAKGHGPSGADQAFINLLWFYSRNDAQTYRLFLKSGLGKRKKVLKRPDYVMDMIENAHDQEFHIDIEGRAAAIEKLYSMNGHKVSVVQLVEPANALVAGSNPAADTIYNAKSSIPIPLGRVGQIADFIYRSAPHPVPEIALGGALGLMAGICGRAYNISGAGLNQYIIVLAETGMGKEQAQLGINKLINAVNVKSFPFGDKYICSDIASGTAILQYLSFKSPCVVSLLGEFGLRLEQMHTKNNMAEISLRRILLDLYGKSAHGHILRPTKFATHEKKLPDAIDSPAFSILGESVPSRVYDIINEDNIIGGLLPRFLFIEYKGHRPYLNKNHANVLPPEDLVDWLAKLISNVEKISNNKSVIEVRLDDAAEKLAEQFGKYITDEINKKKDEVTAGLLNRAYLKAIKLAAKIAIGYDMENPIVTYEILNWSLYLIHNDIARLTHKFVSGEIGGVSEESKQMIDIKRNIKEYYTDPWEEVEKYIPDFKDLYDKKIIPYMFFSNRTSRLASFKNDKKNGGPGTTVALKKAIEALVVDGYLIELPAKRGEKRTFMQKEAIM